MLAVSTTNVFGDTFSHPKDIYRFGASFEQQFNPSIAIDSNGVIHAVWTEYGDVFYTLKFPDTLWKIPVRVCSTSAPSSMPQLAVSNNTLHLLWAEKNNLYYIFKSKVNDWATLHISALNIIGFSKPRVAISATSIGVVFSGYIQPDSASVENHEIFFIEIPKN